MITKEMNKMSSTDLVVEAALPSEINTFEYTRNHHYLLFKKKNGQEIKEVPSEMLLYVCDTCTFEMLTISNHGDLQCPVCGVEKMRSKWMKKQTCWVPEKESDFEWPK